MQNSNKLTPRTVDFKPGERNVFLHLLTKCNLACRHCYINPAQHGTAVLAQETVLDWLRLFARPDQSSNVVLLGGEPTLHPDLVYCQSPYEACEGADALVIVTEWNQFRSLDLERIKTSTKGRVVVDLRNVCNPERMAEHGFEYHGVGRGATEMPE